jgi:diketogulonate reductase-like aldo/keto reductase
MQYFELTTGDKMPALGLGTWQLKGNTATEAVRTALELGYDHIDTADAYGNHQAVAKALKEVDTDKIFITTKVRPSDLHHDDVLSVGNRALTELGIDVIDLLLIHWPNDDIPLKETLPAMAELVKQGKVRNIGVSNFMIHHLEEALAITEVPITVNQVKFHPYYQQNDLLDYCKAHNILVTSYSSFGNGSIVGDQALQRIGEKYGRSFAQVILKWLVTKGIVVIPKSTNPAHIASNMDIFDWELEEEDFAAIERMGN